MCSVSCRYACEKCRVIEAIRRRTIVGQLIAIKFGEKELSALNARADALSTWDSSDWEEAVDWGVPDCSTLCPSEWRMAAEAD
jgi:hypothetical protein